MIAPLKSDSFRFLVIWFSTPQERSLGGEKWQGSVCLCRSLFFVVALCVLSVLIPYSEKRSNKMPVLFNTILEFVDADYELRKNSYARIKGTLLHFVYLDTVLKFYWLIFYKFKIIILTSLFFKLKQTFYVLQHIFCVGF